MTKHSAIAEHFLGGDLTNSKGLSTGATMADHWLLERLEEFHDRDALVWLGERISYRQLLTKVHEWVAQLEKHEIAAGESVALIGDYSPHTVALLIALTLNCNIAIPLTRGLVGRRRTQYLELSEARWVVEFDDSDAWTLSRCEVAYKAPLLRTLREKSEPGLVLFSSGSTGESKAILHSLDRILDKFRQRHPPLRALVFLLFDHIGGINTLLGLLTNGGTAVAIAERTPDAICQAIEKWKVELLPTSPTFLNMLLMSESYQKFDISSLKLITYGTEPMPQTTLQRVVEIFRHAKIKQKYGLSEMGILPSRTLDNGSLQIKVGGEGCETKVVNGTLWVKSPSAMLGYLNYPSPFDADGWMDTGDLVEVDGEWMRILGRRSEMINVGGEKVTPTEVENTILQMENIRDVTVRGRRNPVTGNIVTARVLLHHPEEPEALKQRVQEFCLARLPRYKVPMFVEIGGALETERLKKNRRER